MALPDLPREAANGRETGVSERDPVRALERIAEAAREVVSHDGWRILSSPAYMRMKAALEDYDELTRDHSRPEGGGDGR